MSFSLLADVEIRKITELEPQWFSARDIRLVLLDFDNTIVPYTTSNHGGVQQPKEPPGAGFLRKMEYSMDPPCGKAQPKGH